MEILSALEGLFRVKPTFIWAKQEVYSLLDMGAFSHFKHDFLPPPLLVILVDYNELVEEGGFCSFEHQVGTLEHFLLP